MKVKRKRIKVPKEELRIDGQLFTAQENKLLNQISLEINTKLEKDILKMKELYATSESYLRTMKEVAGYISIRLPEIDEVLGSESFISQFIKHDQRVKSLSNRLDGLASDIGAIRATCARIEAQLVGLKRPKSFIKTLFSDD